MKKQKITEEMNVHDEWYEQAKKQTTKSLPEFINHLMGDYEHDYGTVCHAITAGGLGAMWAMNEQPQGGITGFQASWIMWNFIEKWNRTGNKSGMKLIDYDDMLYPQHEYKFKKTISENVFNSLKKEAKERLEEKGAVHSDVKKHWQEIVAGKVPFGFTIEKEEDEV